MKRYCYDVEIFPNFFSVIFIDVNVPMNVIRAYEIADYTKQYETKAKLLKLINPQIFIIHYEHNDLKLLIDFMTNHKVLIGYNSINYDDNVINFLLMNHNRYNIKGINKSTKAHIVEDLYKLSQELINYGNGWRWSNNDTKYFKAPYYSIDMQKLLYLDKAFISLKQVAVQLKHYRLQDLPYHYTHVVSSNEIPDIIDYNINDVIITYKLYINQLEEVKLRESISEMYNINVRTESRSSTATKLLLKFYSDKSGISINELRDLRTHRRVINYNELINDVVEFETDSLKEFLNKLKSKKLIIGVEKFSEVITFNNLQYEFATGGLHSKDRPNIYRETDTHIIMDADADSYYPYGIIHNEVCPEHLDANIFLDIAEGMIEERISAKKLLKQLKSLEEKLDAIYAAISKYDTKQGGLKIVINSGLYGKLGDENSFMYDLKAMYKVTINLQLMLLMLVEKLHLVGSSCISANTDGIVCIVPKDKLDDYYKACKEWEQQVKFNLEYTQYEKYVCMHVNGYIAIKKGYVESIKDELAKSKYIKLKGLFLTEPQIDKGYKHPIVAKALLAYYSDGIDPKEFITNHRDIYDFCISIKTGSDFIKEYHTIKNNEKHIKELQKNIRYYIANVNGVILKRYTTPKPNKKGIIVESIALHRGLNSIIFNDYIQYDDFNKYNINYNYYVSQVYKVINEISNIVHKKMKNRSYGGLFDNLEE